MKGICLFLFFSGNFLHDVNRSGHVEGSFYVNLFNPPLLGLSLHVFSV